MGKRHITRHDRAWVRHHRGRIIDNAIRLVRELKLGGFDAESLLSDPHRVGRWSKTHPLFCGCTKSYGLCKYDKHRAFKKQRRQKERAILRGWEKEYE